MDRKTEKEFIAIVSNQKTWLGEVEKMKSLLTDLAGSWDKGKDWVETVTEGLKNPTLGDLEGAAMFFQHMADVTYSYSQMCLLKGSLLKKQQREGNTIYEQMMGKNKKRK